MMIANKQCKAHDLVVCLLASVLLVACEGPIKAVVLLFYFIFLLIAAAVTTAL